MRMLKSVMYLLSGAAISSFGATAILAQESTTEDDEEIVVTAQLRQQRLQDVPLAVTALTSEALTENRIENFADLARITPGLVSGSNYGFIRNTSMRGISNNQFGFADDPSIAILTDGVYQGRGGSGMIVNAFYDVERVEIIKGPQATLFGRSSIGGAINTILNQPLKGEYSGNGEIGIGERGGLLGRGAINIPLSSNFTLRIAGNYEHKDGYLKNLNGGSNLGYLDVAAGRAILRYETDSGFDVSVKTGIEDRRQSGSVYQRLGLPKFTVESTLRGKESFSKFKIFDVVLRVKVPISENAAVTSTTSYRDVQNRYVEDYDALATAVGGPYFQQSDDRLFQQDLIFNFDKEQLSLVAGGSFFTEKLDAFVSNYVNQTFAFTGAPQVGLLPSDLTNSILETGDLKGKFEGYSVFADASFKLSDNVTLTGGVRYNKDKKRFTQDLPNPATIPQSPAVFPGAFYNWGYFTGVPITSEKSWDDVAFRAAINYAVSNDLNIYGAFNQGWKAGGIDSFKVQGVPASFPFFFGLDAAAVGGVPNVYDPETSDSWEFGVKGRFFDRKLVTNLALYSYKYRDLQVSVPQGGSSVISNVGKARGRGIELETRFVPNKFVDLFANAAYNDTKIEAFAQLPGQVGFALNQAPKWTVAFGGNLTAPLPDGLGNLNLGTTVSYRSSYRTDNQLSNLVQAQTVTNLRLNWTDTTDKYEIELFGDNIFNVATYARANASRLFLFPVASRSVLGEPRTVGVRLRFKF